MKYTPSIDDIFISTVTKNLIIAANKFSNQFDKKIIFISSLNQVNDLSYSYVFKTFANLKKFVKKFNNKNLFIGRDHFNFNSINSNSELLLNRIIKKDFANDLDFIHLDMSKIVQKKYYMHYFIKKLIKIKKNIKIEIGFNEDGKKTSKADLNRLFQIQKQYSQNVNFLTMQTGSKLFNNENISKINYSQIYNKINITNKNNLFLKEHNTDFKNRNHFKKLKNKNFIFNIGPEFSYYESQLIFNYAKKLKEHILLKKIFILVLKNKNWKKWCNNNQSDLNKFLASAHYFYDDELFIELKEKINKTYPIDKIIIDHHITLLDKKFNFKC